MWRRKRWIPNHRYVTLQKISLPLANLSLIPIDVAVLDADYWLKTKYMCNIWIKIKIKTVMWPVGVWVSMESCMHILISIPWLFAFLAAIPIQYCIIQVRSSCSETTFWVKFSQLSIIVSFVSAWWPGLRILFILELSVDKTYIFTLYHFLEKKYRYIYKRNSST